MARMSALGGGRWRGRGQALLAVAGTLGLLAALVMADALIARQGWRFDLTPEKRFTLSEHARTVLASLDRPVDIVAFLRNDDPRNSEIKDLLERTARASLPSAPVRYRVLDVNRNPAVARQYGVDDYGSIVVESEGRRRAFANPREELLMEAMLAVTRRTRRVVYFVGGHGEEDIAGGDRRHGYSGLRAALHKEFLEVRQLDVLGESGVPADAAAVVVAAPRKEWLDEELGRLRVYVDSGGALLVLIEPGGTSRLEQLLRDYGIEAGEGIVIDPEDRLFAGDSLTMTVRGLSAKHPVSAALRAPPLFSRVRPVSFRGAPRPGIRGIEFLHTGPSSWRTPDPEVLRTGAATFVEGRDQRGPISVGVSVLVAASAPSGERRVGRVIVLGDADFANDFFRDYLGNKDLILNAMNWLAGEDAFLAARPQLREQGTQQFFVSAEEGRQAFVLGTIVEPGLVLVLGIAVHLFRRWRG